MFINEGLKEVGKALLSLANILLVLFLINAYLLQKEEPNIHIVFITIYAVIALYLGGYFAINNKKGDSDDA